MKAVSIVADSRHSSQNLNHSNCNDSVSSHRYTRHSSGTNFCSIMHAAAAAAAAREWKQQQQSAIVMRCKCAYSLFKVHFGPAIVPSPPPPLRHPSLAPVSVSSIIRHVHAYQFLSRFQSRFSSSSSIPPILFPCTRDWGPPHLAQIASTQSVHAAVVTPPRGHPKEERDKTLSVHIYKQPFLFGLYSAKMLYMIIFKKC